MKKNAGCVYALHSADSLRGDTSPLVVFKVNTPKANVVLGVFYFHTKL